MTSQPTSDNPLDLSPEHEQRIRDRAYFLRLQEGQPQGQDNSYWERARELDALHMPVGLEPNPMIAHPDGPPAIDIVDEAALQENLGEFPDRVADQGERRLRPRFESHEAGNRLRFG